MVERATWWVSSGPCAHGKDWEIDPIIFDGYDETGTGASVDAFALGDRQWIWWDWDGCLGGCLCSRGSPAYDETGMGASVDAFALGDHQCIGYWDGCLGGWLSSWGPPVTYWIKCDYGWCLGGCLCSRGRVVLWIKRFWWPLEIVV